MRRPETARAVIGLLERLTLQPEDGVLSLLIVSPIDQHAVAITALGPDANGVRAVGGDPGPVCSVAVLPMEQPTHPDTGTHAVARACLDFLEACQVRGDLRGLASELELRAGRIGDAAREDRLQATARQRSAQ